MAPLDRPELGFVDRHEPARPHEHVEGDAAGQTAGGQEVLIGHLDLHPA